MTALHLPQSERRRLAGAPWLAGALLAPLFLLPGRARAGEIACDEALFERLRQARKRLADERIVPLYILLSDYGRLRVFRAAKNARRSRFE